MHHQNTKEEYSNDIKIGNEILREKVKGELDQKLNMCFFYTI